MAHFPPWPPAAGSPSAHPSSYPPPPPLPPSTAGQTMALPPELQALNITPQQMAALLTHLQAGTFPFPPPPPPPPPPPQTFQPNAAFAPVPFPPHVPTQTPVGQSLPTPTAVPSHMDIDREEGEVSDVSGRPSRVPTAPGSKKRKSRASQLAHRTAPHQPSTPSTLAKNNPDVSQVSLQQKRDAVLPFIAALHQEGFTFDEFVREGFEENLLRQVYQDLQISTAQEQALSAQAPLAETAPAKIVTSPVAQPSPVAPVKEVKPVVPAKQVAPMSRQDYLARLQAAKNKKAEAVPSKQPVQSAKSATPPAKEEIVTPPVAIPAQAQSKPPPTSNKQSQTTELIRKKMEALKATQRRLANSGTPASPASIALPTSNATLQSQPKPTPTSPSNSFGKTPLASSQSAIGSLIPGLRMSTATAKSPQPQPQVQSALSAAPSFSSASTNSSNTSTPQPSTTASASVARKRPVASDLNEAQVINDHRPFKRPFGRSRHNSFDGGMIIQVSDDEDTSDDDDELRSAKPPVKASAILTGQRDKNIRDLPPLRDFPQRSAAFTNQSGAPTPPLGTPGISSEAEELRRKELEINSLNQRIKDFEKRKAAIKAKAHALQSQPQTPSQIASGSEKTTALPTPNAAKPSTTALAVSGSRDSVDRRIELNAALTARSADIVDQKARILEMQRQVAEMQRHYDQDMENQQKLREELESLDVNTEGMTQFEMEAKKQEIDDLHEMQAAGLASNGPGIVEVTQTQDDTDVSMSEGESDDSSDDAPTISRPIAQSPQRHRDATASSPGRARVLEEIRADRAKAEQIQTEVSESSSESDSGSSMSESSDSEDEEAEVPQSNIQIPTDASASMNPESEAASGFSKPTSAESEFTEPQDEPVWLFVRNVPPMATEDIVRSFFGAFDVQRIHLPRHSTRKTGTGSGFVKLPLSQAVAAIDQLSGHHIQTRKVSIQMSKFEPQLPPSPSPEPSSASSNSSSSSSSSSEDDMDISTDSEDDSEDNVSNAAAPSTKQPEDAPAGSSVDDAPDSDATSSGDEDEDRMDLESSDASSEEYSPEPAAVPVSPIPQSQSSETSRTNLADDLAPELQPTAEQQVGVSEAVSLTNGIQRMLTVSQVKATPSSGTTFKPYESVLKNFKGYRFHPDYPREVQGGYRSLTFSHQIDPNKELCRFEVARGVCNDSSCEYQHFRDMAVSGASEGATS
ncbi:hypothetical protein D6D19_00701 [Aureobasidium pullulans]|uniref:RRM domain-containing protein n=1 Tax=Aureobasidium pullulans TaxID=5580 RepID=A0A4V4IT41_AURPU|nr:hypothetical protein D6D19_00701 [Aureobasidium pullulans]